SANLVNLKLQALRRIAGPSALDAAGTLLAFDYDIRGQTQFKGLPATDERTRQLASGYRAALAAAPDDRMLRLNFGHFLLTQRDFGPATEQFEAVCRAAPDDAEAVVGLGLAAFGLDRFGDALSDFERAAMLDPSSFTALLNAAITCERLDQHARAEPYLPPAERLAPPPGTGHLIR